MSSNRIFKWIGLAAVLGLIAWGVVALEQKSASLGDNNPPQVNNSLTQEVNESDWIKGNIDAKNTIVEYGDFQCPACAAYYSILKQVIDEYGDDIRVVYRHFPLTQIHLNAEPTARAAEAAGKQGKFWEMHDLLFENQSEWSRERNPINLFERYAQNLGLNIDQFRSDYESNEVRISVLNDLQSGLDAGVEGTPTFYLNGEKTSFPNSYEGFIQILEQKINN